MTQPKRWMGPWKDVRWPGEAASVTYATSVPRLQGPLGRLWIRAFYRVNLASIRHQLHREGSAGDDPMSADDARAEPVPQPPEWFLALCMDCTPLLEQPFREEAKRNEWAQAHHEGTGHVVARFET